MAVTVDWASRVITVPQSDLSLVSGTLYELDTDTFRLALKAIEASEDGIVFPDTHRHNTEVTVAGTTFARTIEIINGYSVEFEDAAYTVRLAGSNNNLFDVENGILQQNTVQVIATNSGGLISAGTMSDQVAFLYALMHNKIVTDPTTGTFTIYDTDGTTVLYTADLYQDAAGVTPYAGSGSERREEFA